MGLPPAPARAARWPGPRPPRCAAPPAAPRRRRRWRSASLRRRDDRVLFGARAASRELAEWGIERMRFALGIDTDLRPFYERFRFDPLIGAALRANPGLRPAGRPDPFEALVWSICEQLIEYERAAVIERRLVARLGRRCPQTGLRDSPPAAVHRRSGAGAAGIARPDRDPRARAAAGPPGRWPPAASILRIPTTSPAGGDCAGSAGSAPGRCRRWPSPARAAWTSCPPAISAT